MLINTPNKKPVKSDRFLYVKTEKINNDVVNNIQNINKKLFVNFFIKFKKLNKLFK